MDNAAPEEAVTPDEVQCRAAFERGFHAWSRYSQCASDETSQATVDYLQAIGDAFPDHPALPDHLKLTDTSAFLLATGSSSWDTGAAGSSSTSAGYSCTDLPAFAPQKHSFHVTKTNPTRVTLQRVFPNAYSGWLGQEDDHIAILVLAWAYMLSARWSEIISGADSIRYTDKRAESRQGTEATLIVHIGTVSGEAARWWQALLAPGQGWLATVVNSNGRTLHSPGSIQVSSNEVLTSSFSGQVPASAAPPDSATAMIHLSEYCSLHDLEELSRAALSTALHLPLMTAAGNRVAIPSPSFTAMPTMAPGSSYKTRRDPPSISLAQIDKLLALSCNTQGLQAILLSCFFDPEVPCNLVGPFLQGTFAALESVFHDLSLLTRSLMRSSPKTGFLWMGAMTSGAAETLLERARYGSFEVEILSAVWTGTTQTFMQLPLSTSPAVQAGRIRREDECRLAYMASAEYQHNIPMCPWKPFGHIAVEDAELDVQIHARCEGHSGLRPLKWEWDCWEDERPVRVSRHSSILVVLAESKSLRDIARPPTSQHHLSSVAMVPFDKLKLEDDGASCTATLNLFMWLRRGGFAASERHIRRHEWLCEVFDEEEEEATESWPEDEEEEVLNMVKKKRAKSVVLRRRLGRWLASTQFKREASI